MKRLSVVLLMLTLASLGLGCGGAETPVEQAEEREGVEEVAPAPETTEAEAAPLVNFNCASFDTREDAQARLDEASGKIAVSVRRVLDANDNGVACDEEGSNVGADARHEATAPNQYAGADLSPREQDMLGLANCQLAEAKASMTPEQFAAFEEEISDELIDAIEQDIDTNIQTMLFERGYTCGGRAEELLAGE